MAARTSICCSIDKSFFWLEWQSLPLPIEAAENVTPLKAIPGGYTNIKAVAATSDSVKKLRAAMCGCCRQDYMYLNPDCAIYVFNPDKSMKLKVKLIDTVNYPYLSKGMIK
jgi:cytidine deaminase